MVRFTSLTAVLASLPLVFSHPSNTFVSRDERGACGTVLTPEAIAAFEELASLGGLPESSELAGFEAKPLRMAAAAAPLYPWGNVVVPTWIHVIAASEKLEDGYAPDSQLYAQIDVLNEDFAPHNIQFELKGITRTINATWAVDSPGTEAVYKAKLRKGDYSTLNLYFLKALRGAALGYAYYPQRNPTERLRILDGASNDYGTLPGGYINRYNLGRTATHEVGHWFALAHTFDGNNCDGPGDYVEDTPAQAGPTSGCPIGRDSCPNHPGLDPIHNYMDYSVDACYEEFTPLQTKRAWDAWFAFRKPRPCSADNCLRSLRANTIPGRLEESQAFCGEFTKYLVTDVSLVKPYVADSCTGNVISRVSSACTCLPTASAV